MELILTGIGMLLVHVMWKYMLKRTLIDTHRDRLFDLRDNLRDTFNENNWDLNSEIYKRMRDLLNGYLRYTHRFSYSEFNYIESTIKQNKELQQAMKERFERNFQSNSEAQTEYIAQLRYDARQVMMSYMITSSGWLTLLLIFLFPFVTTAMLVTEFFKTLKVSGLKIVEVRELFASFTRLAVAYIATIVLTEDLVEEYSYRQGAYK